MMNPSEAILLKFIKHKINSSPLGNIYSSFSKIFKPGFVNRI